MPATKEQAGAVLAGFVKSQANIVVQSIPNLSVIANDALDIGRLVQDFKTNTTAWAAFGEYVQTAVLQVLQSVNPSIVLPLITSSDAAGDANSTTQNGSTGNAVQPTQFVQNLIKLHEVLEDVNTVIKGMRSSPLWKRVRSFAQDPGAIEDLRQKVDDVLKLFELKAITQMGLSLDKVAADVEKSLRHTEELNESMKRVAISQNQVTLDRLPYTAGSSWDSSKGCFQNTRQTMLQKIKDWIHPSPGQNSPANAEVMAVAGVAGSGKSTVMHTLGQYCANQGWLGSAFFFDRSVEGRNDMFKLFTTMAVDLSAFDPGLESQIVTTTSRDKSLISAMPMRQFEELVSKPLSTYQGQKPVVIIIDAIDEGIDIREPRASPLIDILRDHVQKLPPTVRFLVTYRTHPTLDEYFRDRPHIRNLSIDTRDEQSNSDVSNFIDHELRELSRRKHLGGNWPSEKDVKELAQRAEGLFQWAAMACGYLAKSPNPPRDLKGLTENSTLSSESPEAKMDGLYKAVLESYDWKDPTFAEGINVVLGTILAAKIPLSASALHSLHRMSSVPIDEILQQISPFITRWNGRDRNRPIHIIHQSLREHLTAVPREGEDEQPPAGTNSSSPNRRFMFEKLRSRELALPCLTIMNEQLSDTTPGAGYIHGTQTYEIPKFPKERISEELRYAVQYWTDHLVDVEGQISASLSVALRAFFTSNLVSWMEVACVYGRYQGLRKVIRWIMANIPDRAGIIKHIVNAERAKSLRMLSQHLTHMDRPEEALNALQDAVDLYQQFESDRQSGIDVDLSRSMRLLASQLTQAGRDNEAITASEMTLTIDRRLVEENPGQYMEQLAASLDTYATVMSRVGRNTESFPHIQESVDLYQKLAEQDPGLYSDDLARALNNLAAHLGRMGRDEEAIPIIRDALSAYRYLVQEWPDIHTPHLANTLSNYSTFLSSVGKHQEALPYAEEAVTLYRQLARDRPATYTQDFASGLSKYAAALSELDRRVEALPIMREATELLRAQYAERPDANIARFASALYNLSSHLNALHQYAEGLEVTIEAVDIYQILNERQHGIHKFSLGVLFSRLHRAYEQLDQEDDAFAAILEAVRYYRETDYNSDTNGNIHTSLAVALSSLSTSYAKIGYEEECINFAKESVDVLRIAVAAEPENIKTRYTLGQSLLCLNGHYLRAARAEESHPCATEAVEIYRELAGILPSVYTDDLAESYGKLCRSLEELNRMDEALAAGIESLCLYRACAEENPLQFNSKVLDSYVLVMRCLIGLDDQETVADMMNEAIQMYRTTLETCPDSLNNRLADLYEKLASNLEARMAAAAAGI